MFIYQLIAVAATILLAVAEDQLLLLQVAWRHGDRSPVATCKGDPNQVDKWPQGWGQLTARGMSQQNTLGKLIYHHYAEALNFLSPYYSSSELYVRSTDVNRTLISAISNFVGFYDNYKWEERRGIDYPNITDWPRGFVAVPIHTVRNDIDFVGNPDAKCPRHDWLYSLVQQTPEWANMTKKYATVLKDTEAVCQQTINWNDFWLYPDAFYCDKVHGYTIPVNDSFHGQMVQLDNTIRNFKNGLDLLPYDGIDFKTEIGKIRGGSMLWSMLDHFDLKLYCLRPENQGSPHCTWMKNLKYYAYSVHDSTLMALMCTLDAEQKILTSGGIPQYSAALLFELWNTSNGPGLKVYYHRNFSEIEFENVTPLLDHCSDHMVNDYCNYNEFRTSGIVYYPGNEYELCQDTTSKKTSFNPDQPQTSTPKPKAASTLASGLSVLLALLLLKF